MTSVSFQSALESGFHPERCRLLVSAPIWQRFSLDGKRAVVTGTAAGIGQAMTRALARNGCEGRKQVEQE